uniref:Uncharacterized protein n=1 Tax=Brassica oleracea var. oleracea TaxID=109376 RepID=A0A0D3ARF1_BRAOL
MRRNQSRKIRPFGVAVVVVKTTVDVDESTIHKIGSHSSGSALSNPLREKNTKEIPPRSEKKLVSDEESVKGKEKEVNFAEHSEGTTHLDASDFVNDFEETAITEA